MEEPIKTKVDFDPNQFRALCRKANHPETHEKGIKEMTELFAQLSPEDLGFARQIINNQDF